MGAIHQDADRIFVKRPKLPRTSKQSRTEQPGIWVTPAGTLDAPERSALAGWIAYARGIEPDFVKSLIAKYGLALVRRA